MKIGINLTGCQFGKWTVIEWDPANANWICKCSCGTIRGVDQWRLRVGGSKSCGCPTFSYKHPLYNIWQSVKGRCFNKNKDCYDNYGGRGILMFEEWIDDPEKFIEWGIKNGWKPGLTIERKDVDGNYVPDNCTFIPLTEQALNRRNTIKVIFEGKEYPLSAICRKIGISRDTVYTRITKGGMSGEEALSAPIRPYHKWNRV